MKTLKSTVAMYIVQRIEYENSCSLVKISDLCKGIAFIILYILNITGFFMPSTLLDKKYLRNFLKSITFVIITRVSYLKP